jgi:hypothetical protein
MVAKCEVGKDIWQVSILSKFTAVPNHCTGSLVYLKVLGRPIVFANSYEATMDLLDKRSLIYSSRLGLIMLRKL